MGDYREVRIRLSDEEWAQLEEIRSAGNHETVTALARQMLKEMLRDDRLAHAEGVSA